MVIAPVLQIERFFTRNGSGLKYTYLSVAVNSLPRLYFKQDPSFLLTKLSSSYYPTLRLFFNGRDKMKTEPSGTSLGESRMNFSSYGLLGYDLTGLYEPITLWVIPELQIILTRKTPEGLI